MAKIQRRSIVSMLLLSVTGDILAEEKVWPQGVKALALSEKLRQSFDSAWIVLLGRFTPKSSAPPPDRATLDIGMQVLDFRLSANSGNSQLSGIDVISVKMPVYLASNQKSTADGPSASSVSRVLSAAQGVERQYSGMVVDEASYMRSLSLARSEITRLSKYLQEFVLVPISIGSLDTKYRVADVVVEYNKEYCLIIFRRMELDKGITLFSSDFDLYNSQDPDYLNFARAAR